MAINFILAEAWDTDPQTEPMGRSWVGWDPTRSADELWAQNRGVWRLEKKRVASERYATLSFDGVVQVVARIGGSETYQDGDALKTALIGEVLPDDHPVALALLGRRVPAQRNPVVYLDTADIDDLEDGPATARAIGSNHPVGEVGFLLTYNPDRWTWDEDEVAAAVAATRSGRRLKGNWATGSRTSGIAFGDRAFLLRQGPEPRGIMAAGSFRSGVWAAPHFDDSRTGTANYALVEWDTVLEAEEVLPLGVIQQHLPERDWTPMGGGTIIAAAVLGRLEMLWADHLAALGRDLDPRGGGQGRQVDAVRRRLVEDAAQSRLVQLFEDAGWTVEDTHLTHPYDAKATRAGETRYLEAKGTVTAGRSVLVTQGEVLHARAHQGQCVMGILSGVAFDGSGVVPGSGSLRVFDWDPDAGRLEPATYTYVPPAE